MRERPLLNSHLGYKTAFTRCKPGNETPSCYISPKHTSSGVRRLEPGKVGKVDDIIAIRLQSRAFG
jgi:hypothetical protein